MEENKEILFGKLNQQLSQTKKKNLNLARIFQYAKSIEYPMPEGKMYDYLCDTIWNNLKRPVTNKLIQFSQTGGEPDENPEFTDIENAVLDIIGRHSAATTDLAVRETFDLQSEAATSQVSGDNFNSNDSSPCRQYF